MACSSCLQDHLSLAPYVDPPLRTTEDSFERRCFYHGDYDIVAGAKSASGEDDFQ